MSGLGRRSPASVTERGAPGPWNFAQPPPLPRLEVPGYPLRDERLNLYGRTQGVSAGTAAGWGGRHGRCKFDEAKSSHPRLAAQALGFFQQLYDLEDRARDFTPAARQSERGAPERLLLVEVGSAGGWAGSQLDFGHSARTERHKAREITSRRAVQLGLGTGARLSQVRSPSCFRRKGDHFESRKRPKSRRAQFTSQAFTGLLEAADVAISRDGRGRALDNVFFERLWRTVKYENIYLHGYETAAELERGLAS